MIDPDYGEAGLSRPLRSVAVTQIAACASCRSFTGMVIVWEMVPPPKIRVAGTIFAMTGPFPMS